MAITVGTTVVMPSGRKAKVRAVEKNYTGKRGRPALIAVVQPISLKGTRMLKSKQTYWMAELQAA
jgi:hypothetical protein